MSKFIRDQLTRILAIEAWVDELYRKYVAQAGIPLASPLPIRQFAEQFLSLKIDIETFDGPVSSASAFVMPTKDWILLKKETHPIKRRFSEAHEIAHWLVERGENKPIELGSVSLSALRSRDGDIREKLVNYFAAALLIPYSVLAALDKKLDGRLPDYTEDLAIAFRLSKKTTAKRVKEYTFLKGVCEESVVDVKSIYKVPDFPFAFRPSRPRYRVINPPKSIFDYRFVKSLEDAKDKGLHVYLRLTRENLEACEAARLAYAQIKGVLPPFIDLDQTVRLRKDPEVEWVDLSHIDRYVENQEKRFERFGGSDQIIGYTRDEDDLIEDKKLIVDSVSDYIKPPFPLNSRGDAAEYVKQKRKEGKRVIIVTGCFDIVTNAHIQFFHKAKRNGDILVVGIEEDHRIKHFKGRFRPVNTEHQRAEVLSEMRSIDYVFVIRGYPVSDLKRFYTKLHKEIKANVLVVVEGDPNIEDKKDQMKKAGLELIEVSKSADVHSSSIIRQYLDETALSDIVHVHKKSLYDFVPDKEPEWQQPSLPISLLNS